MELKIQIKPENKDQIMELIPLILEAEQSMAHEISNRFAKYRPLSDYTQTVSRHKGDKKNVAAQLKRIAKTYASGKVALLRVLHVVNDTRGHYNVIGEL